jgi:F-type H+-transporting ATPase subunit delta
MLHTRTTRRYAKVLFNMAKQTGQVENVRGDLAGLRDLVRQNPDLSAFLTNYMVPSEHRIEALKTLFERRVSALTYRFLMYLEEEKRMRMLEPTTGFFNEICDRERGVVKAKITTARPLASEQVDAFRKKLQAKFKKEIAAETATDPALLGGFTVQIGDVIYNSSAAYQLEVFKQKIITA